LPLQLHFLLSFPKGICFSLLLLWDARAVGPGIPPPK
jgi:hypothetical protein